MRDHRRHPFGPPRVEHELGAVDGVEAGRGVRVVVADVVHPRRGKLTSSRQSSGPSTCPASAAASAALRLCRQRPLPWGIMSWPGPSRPARAAESAGYALGRRRRAVRALGDAVTPPSHRFARVAKRSRAEPHHRFRQVTHWGIKVRQQASASDRRERSRTCQTAVNCGTCGQCGCRPTECGEVPPGPHHGEVGRTSAAAALPSASQVCKAEVGFHRDHLCPAVGQKGLLLGERGKRRSRERIPHEWRRRTWCRCPGARSGTTVH